MKRIQLAAMALLGLGLVLFSVGCMTARRQAAAANRPVTYALVVSVNGGQAPTDEQWAMLQKKFAAVVSSRGGILLTDPTFADKLIHVQFYPDADDPAAGSVYVVGIRNNPTGSLVVASSGPTPHIIPASYGYSSYYGNGPSYPYSSYFSDYYGYFTDYPGPVTTIYRPPHSRDHDHNPGDANHTRPIDCLPSTPSKPAPTFVAYHPGDGSTHWRTAPHAGPSSSNSNSAYSSSSYSSRVYDSPSPSYSSSYSAPSISMGDSSSYSSSSSSYSSPVYDSPSSSSSSSAPSISMGSSSAQPR